MSDFKREERYLVVKLSDLIEGQEEIIRKMYADNGIPVYCVDEADIKEDVKASMMGQF